MEQLETVRGLGPFVAELRRRHVVRVAIAYTAVWFVVLQTAEIVFPAFLPGFEADAGLRVLVVGFVALLPLVLTMAWVYEVTPHGIRTMDALDAASGRAPTRRILPRVALAFLMLVAGGVAYAGWYRMDSEAVAEAQERRATARAAFAGSRTPEAPASPPFSVSPGSLFGDPGASTSVDQASRDLIAEGSITQSGDEVRVTIRIFGTPASVDAPSGASTATLEEAQRAHTEMLSSMIGAVADRLLGAAATEVTAAGQEERPAT